jgi:predicted methyltransferase
MREDLASFTGCETRVLVDDVEERFVNLPDIVEQRDALNDSSIVTIELRGFREDERVRGNSAHVCSGLSIVCVDCIEE